MPRDGSGVYHTPVGTDGVPDTTIESSKYNVNVHDVETDLNTPRPVVAGGTGGGTVVTARANLGAEMRNQIVVDFNTMVWEAGSFYAATTATNSPVAAHAFAGVAYAADASNFVLEARDVTDANHPQYYRIQSAGVWGAWKLGSYDSTAADTRFVNVTGDTMTGQLTLVAPPVSDNDAVSSKSALRYDAAQTLTAPQQTQAQQNIGLNIVMRSYLAGLTLSTAGSSQIFGIAAGAASDSANALMMTLPAAYTKTTSAWVVGSGNGSLDTGTIAASTWYHVHLIRRPDTGVVDVLISLFDAAPTLPANYSQFRRIGSMLTNASSQWLKFVQTGDEFLWDAPTLDINGAATGVPSQTFTMPVAPNSEAIMNLYMVSNTVNTVALAHSLVAAAASVVNAPLANFQFVTSIANAASQATVRIRMNAARQFRVVSNATTATCTITGTAIGWIDRRGRDA